MARRRRARVADPFCFDATSRPHARTGVGEITTANSPTLGTRCGEEVATPVKQKIDLAIRDADLLRKGDGHNLDAADQLVEPPDRPNPSWCAGYRAGFGAISTRLARGRQSTGRRLRNRSRSSPRQPTIYAAGADRRPTWPDTSPSPGGCDVPDRNRFVAASEIFRSCLSRCQVETAEFHKSSCRCRHQWNAAGAAMARQVGRAGALVFDGLLAPEPDLGTLPPCRHRGNRAGGYPFLAARGSARSLRRHPKPVYSEVKGRLPLRVIYGDTAPSPMCSFWHENHGERACGEDLAFRPSARTAPPLRVLLPVDHHRCLRST